MKPTVRFPCDAVPARRRDRMALAMGFARDIRPRAARLAVSQCKTSGERSPSLDPRAADLIRRLSFGLAARPVVTRGQSCGSSGAACCHPGAILRLLRRGLLFAPGRFWSFSGAACCCRRAVVRLRRRQRPVMNFWCNLAVRSTGPLRVQGNVRPLRLTAAFRCRANEDFQ